MIPARGGSKGLPGKNLRQIAGKSLVQLAVECAQAAARLHWRIVVSSDDDAVLDLATQLGADALPRPAYLATDASSSVSVALHALLYLLDRKDYPDAVCLLQPTNPLRLPSDIDAAIELMRDTGCGSVITHAPAHSHPKRQIWADTQEPLLDGYTANLPRQALRPVLDRDGAVYLTRTYWLRQGTWYAPDGRILVIPRERHLDIEDRHDLELARCLFPRRRLYQHGGER